ncbi:MAG: murein biosynthesis integral membrane protein MurJ [Candidatus Magasanikbacteria bacterium]
MVLSRLLETKYNSITGAAIIIGAASLVSRIIGLVRDRLFAHYFGAGDIMDAYYAAFRIPDFVYNIVVVGALSAGFIPVFMELLVKDKEEARRVTNSVITILAFTLTIVCLILYIFTPQLVTKLTPGFLGSKYELTLTFTRIMLLSPVLLGISGVISGVLQSYKAFLVYSLTPIMYNIGIIVGVTVFVPLFGLNGLAYGVILGALMHLCIQIPALIHYGFNFRPLLLWKHPSVRKIGWLLIPRTLGMATQQINKVAITIIGSLLVSGSLTIFNLADNLQSVPSGIVGISFGMAIFPVLAELAAQNKKQEFVDRISSTTRQILFLILPLTILFIILRAQIVRVTLGTGKFDWDATVLTFQTLAFFSISLFAQSLIPMLARAFYALQDTWTPFIIGMCSTLVNVLAALYFAKSFGVIGLACAYSASMIIQTALLWIFLRHKTHGLNEKSIVISIIKMSVAVLGMGFVIQLLKKPMSLVVDMEKFWGILTQGLVCGTVGLITYLVLCRLLKLEEVFSFQQSLKRKWLKFRGTEIEPVDQ